MVPSVLGAGHPNPTKPTRVSYVFSPWISSLVEFLLSSNLTMRIEDIWRPEPLRQHDSPIMELIIHKLPRSELRDINAVRMFLRVSMLSEITTTNGRLIRITHRPGHPPFLQQANSLPNWPRQPNPSPRAWSRWRRMLRSISHERKLKEPPGPWLLPAPPTWKFFTSNEIPHHLLQRSGSQWLAHKRISGRHWSLHRRDGNHILSL